MSVFTGGPYGRLADMLNTLSSLNIEIIIIIISLNFGQVLPRNVELATLWCLKNSPKDLQWGNCSEHSSAFIFDWILFIVAGHAYKLG